MKKFSVKNPYSGELLNEYSYASVQEISSALEQASAAFQKWRHSSAYERSQLLTHVAGQLERQKEEFASLICQEAGKPIQLARIEVERSLGVLKWASAEAQRYSGELLRLDVAASGRSGFGIHQRFPRGVVLGITPFNFPLNLGVHKVAPAIACGCSIVIKPSPATPLTAIRMAKLFESALPGLVQVILADDSSTADLTRRPEIATISFTGSSHVGWKIRQQAPEKPTVLELGGNAWMIVMEDTPPSLFPVIAKRIAGAAFGYAGQSCISVQNVAVASVLASEFGEHLKKATESTEYGDPSVSSVICGPVIHEGAAHRIHEFLDKVSGGAEVMSSQKKIGNSSDGSSKATVLAPRLVLLNENEKFASLSNHEEVFGPVMTARKFGKLSDLTQWINSSPYGLQAGVYTQNWAVIQQLYRDLEVGGLVVNDVPTTRYDNQPYGGIKESGQGREGVRYAMDEMTDSKFLALSSQVLG